ncbi:MAG: peptidylprolyl isomerase [Gammaproteobacteria bacterium]|nr:peptidylprolyl isomerase [Gammaproteobacteria bacterium]
MREQRRRQARERAFLLPSLVGRVLTAAALGLLALEASPGAAKPVQVAELLSTSPAEDWRKPDPENTLYLDLSRGRVIIELAPQVAPQHVANIKALARAHYFDGLAIVRAQDNYVIQWNDPDHRRPLPPEVRKAIEFTAPEGANQRFQPLSAPDVYAPEVGFLDGFPAARDPRSHTVWLAHCYGMVGVGRDDPAESDGTEMYAVIGNAPRQLDRNVSLVGRVLDGMELFSTLPRGTGEMGFYEPPQPLVPLLSVRVAADLPAADRPPLEVLRTDSATFRAVLEQRRNRREDWFKFNPGRIDLCNVPLPVRVAPQGAKR